MLELCRCPNIYGPDCIYIQTWSELLVSLVNMMKQGCGNKSALLILLIYYLKNSQKSNLSLENKNLKWGEISNKCFFLIHIGHY